MTIQKDFESVPTLFGVDETRKRPRAIGKAIAKLAGACLINLGVQNYDNIGNIASWDDQSSMVADVPGCPAYEAVEREQPLEAVAETRQRNERVEREYKSEVSSAREADITIGGIVQVTGQVLDFLQYPQDSYPSRHSGVIFDFYSDQQDMIATFDKQAFDDAFHLGLTANVDHPNSEIAWTMGCLRRRIISEDEFAGEHYTILLPSAQYSCIVDGVITDTREVRPKDCESAGSTPPRVEVEFLWGNLFSHRFMLLTAGSYEAETRERDFFWQVVHEGLHAAFVLTDTPLRLDPDERNVDYNVNQVRKVMEYSLPVMQFDERFSGTIKSEMRSHTDLPYEAPDACGWQNRCALGPSLPYGLAEDIRGPIRRDKVHKANRRRN